MNIHSGMSQGLPVVAYADQSEKASKILGAALRLFSERGFHGTTVPTIAKEAGVGAGTVYRYFESKEAIVNVLYRTHKKALGALIVGRITPDMSPRVQFGVYWQTMAEFARQQPAAYKFLELHHHAPYLDEDSQAIETQLTAMAAASFERFRQQRVVKDTDARILMAIVHGAFVGLVKACSGTSLVFSEEAVNMAEQCVWEAIRA